MLAQIAPLPIAAPPSERDLAGLTVAIVGVTIISLLTLLAAGMTFLGRSRRSDAATLQACVAEAIAADVECARVDVVTTVGTVSGTFATLTGAQLSGKAYSAHYTTGPPGNARLALNSTPAPANQTPPSIPVIDRLTVEADRAA